MLHGHWTAMKHYKKCANLRYLFEKIHHTTNTDVELSFRGQTAVM